MYRGGTWLLPFHRMVPLPRSFAADAHDCIMVVGLRDPTEYKVVAREFRVPRHKSSTRINGRGGTRRWRADWKCSASRLALTRARFAAVGLDPSALPVCVARHSVGALRRHSAKDKEGLPARPKHLTINSPYKAPPTRAAPSLVRALRDARGALLFATGTSLFRGR